MKQRNRIVWAVLALCVVPAAAEGEIVSNGQIAGGVAVIAAVGVGIGIGVYFAVNHGHSIAGCAHSGQDGLQLTTESDKQTYTLTGDVAAVKPGNRVRLSGKKKTDKTTGIHQFQVEKVSKDFGSCGVSQPQR